MSIIYVLIPIALIFVTIAILVFFWAVKSNQYDDLDREGVNILFDEDIKKVNKPVTTGAEKSEPEATSKDIKSNDH